MHLKSIDLVGFKSFTDKTKISLEPGISCIVGPNGSGKSNVADAIRWVLGEQSARNLRGNKLEDVIFAGSKKRKSVGMAEVTLTLDNSDGFLPVEFAEVMITRRAYRSGDSEYLLNGKNCRLKDIQNFFVDTGISPGGFSLVSQGRINEIIAMKPEERRTLVDEAAGIVRYRNRKKEAGRKLENTERNLERINDIIGELSDRLEPLCKQANQAEVYLDLTKKTNELEINLAVQNIGDIKSKLDKMVSSFLEKTNKILAAQTKIDTTEAQVVALKQELQTEEEVILAEQQHLYELNTEKEKVEGQIKVVQAKGEAINENVQRLKDELANLSQKDGGFVAKVALLQETLTEKVSKAAQDKAEIGWAVEKQEEEKAALEDLLGQIESYKEEAFDLANQHAQIKNELIYLKQLKDKLAQEIKNLTEEEVEIKNTKNNQSDRQSLLTQTLAEINKEEKTLQDRLANLTKVTGEKENNITQLAEVEVALRYKLNSEQSRLNMMQEMSQGYEGYYPGVKALLLATRENKKLAGGFIGVVAQLIEVDDKSSIAIEAALGGALQDIITEDEQSAKNGIAYLKENKAGRATFLPLSTLQPRKAEGLDKLRKSKGLVGIGSELVQCSAKVRPAVDYLLGNILVAEDLDAATLLAKEVQYRYRVVTLEGDIVNPGGSMTGGSRQNQAKDLLSRKRELGLLVEKTQKMAAELAQLHEKIAQAKANQEQDQKEKQEYHERIRELEIKRLTLLKDKEILQAGLIEQERQLQFVAKEKQEKSKEIEELAVRRAELEKEITEWQAISDRTNQNINQLQEDFAARQSKLEIAVTEINVRKVELARDEQANHSLQAEIERLKSEKKDVFEQEKEKREKLQELETQIKTLADERSLLQEKLASLELASKDSGDVLSLKRHEFMVQQDNLTGKEKQIKEIAKDLAAEQQELHQQEIKKTRIEAELENETNKLWENFQLSYENAMPLAKLEMSRREIAGLLKDYCWQIDNLGAVNINAIEEYVQVNERYTFLTKQKQDLTEAIISLNKVIKEMDNIMRYRFKETLEEVSREFDISFNRLFGGGNASLMMTDEENVLETGIELVVQPPGKKLTNYNLLSGGEKALIGIALMFAIFQVKPSPFCVLDEVDASLDEANVNRFAEYLQEFERTTQFILISHRQGTMEVAAALWGITMEEEGVSTVISVRLFEAVQMN